MRLGNDPSLILFCHFEITVSALLEMFVTVF